MKINTDKMFSWYQQKQSVPFYFKPKLLDLLFFFFTDADGLPDASENVSDILPLWHPTDSDAPITKNGRLNRFWPNPKPHRDTPSRGHTVIQPC